MRSMPREIFPASYECDCGHWSDFSESTIKEAKQRSHKEKMYLIDSAPDRHVIVFYGGVMVEIVCPHSRQEESVAGEACHGKA